MKLLIFLASLMILPKFVFAQSLIGTEYNSYYFESNGNLWISSSNGWNKYNGYSTTQYKNGILGDYIQSSLFEDRKGNLWSSTYEYLNKYNPILDNFQSFQIEIDGQKAKSNYFIFKIDKLKNELWLKAESNLFVMDLNKIQNSYISKIHTSGRRFAEANINDTLYIIAMPWADGLGIERKKYINNDFVESRDFLQSSIDSLEFRDGVIIDSVFWGCSSQGIIRFNIFSPNQFQLFNPPGLDDFYPHHLILYGSNLFITSKDHGLWEFDILGEIFKNKWNTKNGLKNNSPMEIFIQDSSFLWLSYLEEGVQKLSLSKLTKDKRIQTIIDTIPSRRLFAINDSIIINLCINGSVRSLDFYGNSRLLIEKHMHNLDNLQDSKWVNNILRLIDKNTNVIFDIVQKKLLSKSKLAGGQFNFIEASNTSTNYISTTTGIFPLDSSYKFTNCDSLNNVMFYKKDGDTYIVNKANEVLICNQDTIINLGQYGWPVQMSEDSIDNMLLASKQGLFKIKDQRILTVVDTKLPLDNIRGFAYDKDRNLWFTRTKNIYVYTYDSTLIRIPSEHDIEFSNSAPIFPENEVWFATNKGVLSVSNEIYKKYQETPHTYVMEVHVNGLKYDSPLNPDYIENMNLTWQENDLNFRTEVGEYTGDNHQSIKYRMAGLEEEWNYSSDFNLTYKNLQPGNYSLEMIGIGSNLKEAELKKIDITISAPFYQTWWFRGSVAAGLVLIGFGVNFYRTKKKLREQEVIIEKQKALQHQRNRMAQDLHDEMGSGLTTIKYISNSLKSERGESEKIEQIENTSTNLIGSMRDLLWSLDESNDTLGNLVSKSRTILHQMCKGSAIETSLNVNIDKEQSIPGIHRRNIILIIKEAITNVRKHAEASHVEISFSQDKEQLIISISDNGKGMADIESHDLKSYGLKSIRNRVEGMEGEIEIRSSNTGTTIEIKIPLIDQ